MITEETVTLSIKRKNFEWLGSIRTKVYNLNSNTNNCITDNYNHNKHKFISFFVKGILFQLW